MKIISIFIVLFILLSAGTCLFANHSYYCDCNPPPFGECECNETNGHPVTWSNKQPVGKVGIGRLVTTYLWINCTGYKAVVPSSGDHADGPSVWKSSGSINCAPWWLHPSIVATSNAYDSCTNRSVTYKHYIKVTHIKCANYYS